MGNAPSSSSDVCKVCSIEECKVFDSLVKDFGLEPKGWTCRPGSRFEVGSKTKTVTMPKLVLLSDPGYQDYDKLLSLVDKTVKCNSDYRHCYLEGYFEVITTFEVNVNEYVSTNWWARTRVYLTRATKALGQATFRIVSILLIGGATPAGRIGW
ncbi:hypothetical protein BGZ58_008446 [Dissophora ornata]|nr:hypothetical protein BGZ58_008446 [Dissophora ornata]